MLERSAPFFVLPSAPFEGAGEGAESAFLPASNTISITLLLASRLVAEIARVYTSSVIREFAWRRSSCAVLRLRSPQACASGKHHHRAFPNVEHGDERSDFCRESTSGFRNRLAETRTFVIGFRSIHSCRMA